MNITKNVPIMHFGYQMLMALLEIWDVYSKHYYEEKDIAHSLSLDFAGKLGNLEFDKCTLTYFHSKNVERNVYTIQKNCK